MILDRLNSVVKAAFAKRKVSFGTYRGGGLEGNTLEGSYLFGGVSAGSALDYGVLAGDPLSNSVVATCVNAIAQALTEAPPYLERRVDGAWVRLDSHPLLSLLAAPNPYCSGADVWALTAAAELTRGEAFWYLAFDGAAPREIWVWPTERVVVEGTPEEPISAYVLVGELGQPQRVANHEVVHFRHMPNPHNWRRGWTPLSTGTRQMVGDNAAATYHSAILRNSGVLSLLISLKDGASAGEVAPGQIEGFTRALQRKLSGEGAGTIAGLDLPLDVHKMSYSPDEMALDKLINYYESRICALLGVDPMVAGLGSGTAQKTYANLGEALNDFWERRILPMRARHAATLAAQLFPSFGMSASEWRLRFDTSGVAALQENVDGIHTRWREDYKAGGIDLFTFQSKIGLAPPEEYRGRFFGDGSKPDEVKYSPGQPRDWRGRWSDGGGLHAPDDGGGNIGGAAPHSFDDDKLGERLSQMIRGNSISEKNKKLFSASMERVCGKMTRVARHRAGSGIDHVYATDTIPELRQLAKNKFGRNSPQMVGSYSSSSRAFLLNGGRDNEERDGIYAHEMAHAVDGPKGQLISDSPEWNEAYKTEIKSDPTILSKYATTSAVEGFAEFGRLAYSGDNLVYLKAEMPLCYAVWQKKGLIP